MSDDQDKWLDELGDLDWDSALNDWEKSTLADAKQSERNLVQKDTHTSEIEGAGSLASGAPPSTTIKTTSNPPSSPPAARNTTRGGLGQLFTRTSHPPASGSNPPVSLRTPVASVTARVNDANDDGDPTLIAAAVGSRNRNIRARESDFDEPTTIGKGDFQKVIADVLASQRLEEAAADREPSSRQRLEIGTWLDAGAAEIFRERAVWLEEESRAVEEVTARARALIGVSELFALAGDATKAASLAAEARELAPNLAIAWVQARAASPSGGDLESRVELLDAEAAHASTPAARAHAMLLAADTLRIGGQLDAAAARFRAASKVDPADVRGPTALAALALSQNQHTGADSQLAENMEFVDLSRAMGVVLELRGAARPGAPQALPVNSALQAARTALLAGDVVGAKEAMKRLSGEPELGTAALWLTAGFGALDSATRRDSAAVLEALAQDGESLALVPLAARGLELQDATHVLSALNHDSARSIFAPTDRVTLLALSGNNFTSDIASLNQPEHAPLACALSAVSPVGGEHNARRAQQTAGDAENRALTSVGRLLAAEPSQVTLDGALRAIPAPHGPVLRGVALETAVMSGRWTFVCEAISTLHVSDSDTESSHHPHMAAALLAERSRLRETANGAWRSAFESGANHDSIVRALANADDRVDLSTDLQRLADAAENVTAASILRLEAFARRDPNSIAPRGSQRSDFDESDQLEWLERIHQDAPALGIAPFLASFVARRRGDVDAHIRWIQECRAQANDSLEAAIFAVREGFLYTTRQPDLAGAVFGEGHRRRPDDIALRELYERYATEPLVDRGAWREARAEKTAGAARTLLFTEAAIEYERAGDLTAALRAATSARDSHSAGLWRPICERLELLTGSFEESDRELMARLDTATAVQARRATYEHLAARACATDKSGARALAWHRKILDESPRHKPSLRHVEHSLLGADANETLAQIFEQIALALHNPADPEISGHAQAAASLKQQSGAPWDSLAALSRLAAQQEFPSLWALRTFNGYARAAHDDAAVQATSIALQVRTDRSQERAALLVRASEAAIHLSRVEDARALLEHAASEDAGDIVTWGFLAEVREQAKEFRAAAEACESLARTSLVPTHQLLAWSDAARIWLDEVGDPTRGMTALEQCAEIDILHGDVFARLADLYAGAESQGARLDAEYVRLLEKRLAVVDDDGERVALQVELAGALTNLGETARAKAALGGALAKHPDHTTALATMGDLCEKEGDWVGAEQAYVRLARLLDVPEEQRVIYEKLAVIYSAHTGNLSRAEVAYREVLKREPHDVAILEKLVDVYVRQGDFEQAASTRQQLVLEAPNAEARLQRLIELAALYESAARDLRRAEHVLEAARKDYPTSVVALGALASFYERQRQMPALHILLDRVANDARRSFATGRFAPEMFELLHASYELRGRKDAGRIIGATLGAIEGRPTELSGGGARAMDPQLDELLAPDLISSSLRTLLTNAGDTLDAVSPLDLRQLRVTPLVPGSPLGKTIGSIATFVGLGSLQVLVSDQIGHAALPLSTTRPALLVSPSLMAVPNERVRSFIVVRAMKMMIARASALLRAPDADAAVLVSALITALNPDFEAQGVDAGRVATLSRKIANALPQSIDPTVGIVALETAGTLGDRPSRLGAAIRTWANRVALLAIGEPSDALDALGWLAGEEGAPQDQRARASWIAENAEARELLIFSVSNTYAEARAHLGLGR